MLSRPAKAHGFSMIAVVGTLLIIGLLMLTALHLSQDHLRRATLSADRAVALREAESALAAAECEIAIATGTPYRSEGCRGTPDAARIAALNPVTLSGFAPGACGHGVAQGLCWPLQGESAAALAQLAGSDTHAMTLAPSQAAGKRKTTPARYVIEPIPDALPGQWMHAGAPRTPWLFRITAIGFGPTSVDSDGNAEDTLVNVMLQTVYRPRVAEP